METPKTLRQVPRSVRLRERWALPRIGVTLVMVVVALIVPGASALLLRPENPGEGYVALGLAAAAIAWQVRRLLTAGVEVGPAGIRRLAGPALPWDDVEEVFWHTSHWRRQGGPQGVHRLRARLSSGEEVDLTRHPATDAHADRFTAALRDTGLMVPAPDRSAVDRGR